MSKERRTEESVLKPPYGSPLSFKKFFELVQAQKPDKVDSEFLKINGVGAGNEAKVLLGLRFLGLITENGTPTEKLASLRVVGDDFKKNLAAIVTAAYADLMSKVVLERAKPENLINYLVTKYGMAGSLARNAAKVFVSLCNESGITVSEELNKWETTSRDAKSRPKPKKGDEKPRNAKTAHTQDNPAQDIVELKAENFRIILPKERTLEAAKKAKSLLEWYIKEGAN